MFYCIYKLVHVSKFFSKENSIVKRIDSASRLPVFKSWLPFSDSDLGKPFNLAHPGFLFVNGHNDVIHLIGLLGDKKRSYL